MKKLALLLLIACFCVPVAAQAFTLRTFDSGLERLAKDIADDIVKSRHTGKTVAVMDFKRADGAGSQLGNRISQLLQTELEDARKGQFEIVERNRLALLMSESEDFGTDDSDEVIEIDGEQVTDQGKEVSRFLEADILVTGIYYLTDGEIKIVAKAIVVKGAKLAGAADVNVKSDQMLMNLHNTPVAATNEKRGLDALSTPMSLDEASSQRTSAVSLFKLEKARETSCEKDGFCQYEVGENMGFTITPPMDSNLYIINYDPQGKDEEIIFLYPVPGMSRMNFAGSKKYHFPEVIDPLAASYPVSPPKGRMVFKVIGIDKSVHGVDLTRGLDDSQGYYRLGKGDLTNLLLQLEKLPRANWWAENADFWIR